MLMIRDFSTMFQQMSGMPIGSKGGQSMLKQHGIDTSSKQYKAAMSLMNSSCGAAVGYTNPQAIKNLMRNFDANGDYIDPVSGLTGLDATGIPMSQRHKIINISEESKTSASRIIAANALKAFSSLISSRLSTDFSIKLPASNISLQWLHLTILSLSLISSSLIS